MRTKSAQATAILANPSHQARAMVCVYSSAGVAGPTWGSGAAEGNADPVLKVDVEQSIDSFRTARVTLQRQFGLYSLAPLVITGNPLYGSESPIAVGRRIVITAELVMPDSGIATSTETIFDGYVDEVTWPDDDMLLVCTDKSAKLRDTWIETERVYCFAQGANATKGCIVWRDNVPPFALNDLVLPSDAKFNGHFYKATTVSSPQAFLEPVWPTGTGATVVSGGVTFTESGLVSDSTGTALETLIQQVLNDNGLGSLVTLQTPVSPTWNVKPYLQQRESVMDAIQAMVDQLGWWVRFEWNTGLSKYELTLAQPARTSSTTHKTLLADEEIECSDLSVDLWSIRNVIRVLYGATANRDAQGNPLRSTVEVSDSASIAKYGRRFMEVAEGGSSAIDTSTEATRFAQGILDDLKEPTVGLGLAFPCDFYLELGDRIAVPADGLRFTAPQTLATESLKHSFEANGARTSVTLRGAPAARREEWLSYDGLVNKSDVHQVSMHNTTSIGAAAVAAGALIGGGRIQVSDTRSKQALLQAYEYHVSETSGFTPDNTTIFAAGEHRSVENTQLVPGKTYYGKVVPWSRNASRIVRAAPSDEVSFVAGRAKSGHYDSGSTQSHLPLNGNFEHAIANLVTNPPDHWQVVTRPSESAEAWGLFGSVYTFDDTSKGRCIYLRPSATQRGNIVSSVFEVRRGVRALNIYLSIQRNGSSASSGKDLIVDVFGYNDSALTTQVINYSVFLSGSASGPYPSLATWYDTVIDFGAGYGAIPSNVNFLQIALRRGTTGDSSFSWYVGDVYVQEADFYRAVIDQAAWANVTFDTGWTDYDATNYYPASYFKDSFGVVHLRGLTKRTSGSTTKMFTLPSGFRPTKNVIFGSISSNLVARVDSDSSGAFFLGAGGVATDWVALDGITFDTR